MDKSDLLDVYPSRTFSERFAAKKASLSELGAPLSHLRRKEESLESLFEYDRKVNELFRAVQPNDVALDQRTAKQVQLHFSRIDFINHSLEGLNLTDPKDIAKVFAGFDENLSLIGFTGEPVMIKTVGGVEFPSNRTFLEEQITEVETLLKKVAKDDSPQISDLKELEHILDESKKKFESVVEISDQILSNADKYRLAAETAEKWIESEGRAISSSIKEKSEIFNDKANEHRLEKIWPWLAIAATLGALTIGAAGWLIYELRLDTTVSVGTALLRISLLAVISYGAYLAYKQYYTHRRLYEIYRFKAIALSTMEDLVKTYADPTERASILSQAISIIFTEPTVREDKAGQQRVVDELLDIIKTKI